MEIEVLINFIYTMHYNGLMNFFDISLTINIVHELNYQFLTCWIHYLGVAFYTYHILLKHM
jgi:hypothetical protein